MAKNKTEIEEYLIDIKECIDVVCGIDCAYFGIDGFAIAKEIYNAGYRKQSVGEWIKATPYSQEYCNQCGLTLKTIFGKLPPFCPNCGAKMKTKSL